MNNRQKELLHILLTDSEEALPVQTQTLADKLRCSEKTVRNDLKHIEEFLLAYPSAHLVRKPGIGIYMEIDEEEQLLLFHHLFQMEPKTDEERVIEIAYQLLTNNKPVTLQELATKYYINKATIRKDLENIADWLDRFDLTLVSKQRLGNVVTGTELNKRSALAHLSELIPSLSNDRNYVIDLFQPYEIASVKKALEGLRTNYALAFTDGGFESLLIHALIMIRRIRQRSPVAISDSEKASTYQSDAYDQTGWFFKQLEDVLRISFPENERIYYTWHLISCKKREPPTQSFLYDEGGFLSDVVRKLATRLKQLTMTKFDVDKVLIDGLMVHMHAVINRINFGFPIRNPLLTDIKKMYPYMFSMIVLVLEDIQEAYDIDIPEEEAAYLVLHFQASIERLQEQEVMMKRVLIVCHMGVGMSNLLQAKIQQHYKGMHVLSCIGKSEVSDFLKDHSVDFIISTVSLKDIPVPHIVISPLLEMKDKERLNHFFQKLESEPEREQASPILLSLIDEDIICVNVDLEHRFEVVEMLANSLLDKGMVDTTFVHSALLRERASATSIGGGIAIPHARPATVNHSAVALAVMKEPLEWGTEMVSVVFLLAVTEDDQKVTKEIIQQISSISEQPTLIKALSEAKDISEIIPILKQ
ncbi:activator of the mannose operon (transcriptional antiterminator) [Virgibacillus natechei]|uniref:Activator of the mannose operon (Transcriptional antiterminator) n=1 Tax=Virgibacillus natechei TaxID=1216297 RepID=A0ABS4IHR0_9BACI|nr:BglG family transcription antiterminator [Virgibacillus natechei]MBP1970484.1 activator of the mannose operon (transcriptional antiterminator) [Virgibacillus natechei]UZD14110.1 BglG family transcription antiterminator [Virgibacillus natechei]